MKASTRVEYLDGLRGIAAFIVFMSHIAIFVFPALFNGLPVMARLRWEWTLAFTPLDILWAANFAVCIFFVMSALVLSAFYENHSQGFVGSCVRRYLRLALPIFAVSAITYLIWVTVGMHNLEAQKITNDGWLKAFYLTKPEFTKLFTESFYDVFVTPTSVLNPPLWTMKYELAGSIGVFLLFALVPNRTLRLVALALGAIIWFKAYYMCFVGGVLLYEWSRQPQEIRSRVPVQVSWLCVFVGAYMGAFPYNLTDEGNIWFGWMMFLKVEEWHILGAIPFVFGVMNVPSIREFLCHRMFQYLGKISFALYIVHVPLIGSFMSFLIVQLYWPPHSRLAIFTAAVITIPVTLVCAHFVHKFFDEPSIRFSRFVDRYITNRFPTHAAVAQRPIAAAAE